MTLNQRQLPLGSSKPEYLELFRDCFPETIGTPLLSEAHYNWKYGSQDKAVACFEFAAFEHARMMGYHAALPFHYDIALASAYRGMVCDVMTHSSMRGRGMFTKQGWFATGIPA